MQQTIAAFPPYPTGGSWADAGMWFVHAAIYLVKLPEVAVVLIALSAMVLGQIIAITFGEIWKMKPGFFDQRVGDWKWQLRTYPILVGMLATCVLLFSFLDLSFKSAAGWLMLSALNGAMAWPVFDRVVEPHILPGLYQWLERKFPAKKKPSKDADAPRCEPPGDDTISAAVAALRAKGYIKDDKS